MKRLEPCRRSHLPPKGVVIITVIGLLNKVPGIFGIIAFDFGDLIAMINYFYSVVAMTFMMYGLNGVLKHLLAIRIYAFFYWADIAVTALLVPLATIWFASTDHGLIHEVDDLIEPSEVLRTSPWSMERSLAMAILTIIVLVMAAFMTRGRGAKDDRVVKMQPRFYE
ncbi:hypothetical protein BC938DRAFT_481575 [Jimgerdemannia flammicorona]|uniref:Uncharacterized protein n=1 Tax=Jimgerdemannia flammicorona TaxID=994334 RepID=A0A433QFX6_9FUNG|nr:hypothetical protein BC938DRAFT_481575 [Jimgerdemannia flammicorona]